MHGRSFPDPAWLQPDGATFTIPEKPVRWRIHGIETVNVLRGGEYFFMPHCPRYGGSPTSNRNREGEMTDAARIPVAVVNSQFEAELIAGLLRENGLDAAVSADDAGGQEPQLQLQGVRVLVARADEAAARQILAEAESGQLEG